MKSENNNNRILLNLSNEEALVLLDWVYMFNDGENDCFFRDQAEQRVLWDIEASLEKVMEEVVSPNYTKIVANAREKVRDND